MLKEYNFDQVLNICKEKGPNFSNGFSFCFKKFFINALLFWKAK